MEALDIYRKIYENIGLKYHVIKLQQSKQNQLTVKTCVLWSFIWMRKKWVYHFIDISFTFNHGGINMIPPWLNHTANSDPYP